MREIFPGQKKTEAFTLFVKAPVSCVVSPAHPLTRRKNLTFSGLFCQPALQVLSCLLYTSIHLLSDKEQMVSSLTSSFFKPLFQRVSYLFKNTSYFIAVGQLAENIQEVYQSYQSAVIGLQQNFFLGSNSVSFAGFPESPEYRPDENFRRKLLGSVKQNLSLIHI